MTAQEVKKLIYPNNVDAGVFKSGDSVPFALNNGSGIPFEFYTKSCGCVGTIKLTPETIVGNVKAEYQKSGMFLHLVDGKYCQKLDKAEGAQYFDVGTNTIINDPKDIGEPVPAHVFSQSIQVYFADGKDQLAISPDGEQITGDKLKITVPIKFWVLEN